MNRGLVFLCYKAQLVLRALLLDGESLLHPVERSITAECLAAELEMVFAVGGGPPMVLRMDDGPEVIAQAL